MFSVGKIFTVKMNKRRYFKISKYMNIKYIFKKPMIREKSQKEFKWNNKKININADGIQLQW